MRIGELLVAEGVITERQLELALLQQIGLGGRLGSNLVEGGALDLDTLATALARQHGVPAATRAELDAVAPSTRALVARPLAELHGVVPLQVVDEGGPRLLAAFMDPPAHGTREVLAFIFGMPLVTRVAPELRILYYLEQLYGVARKPRFLRIDAWSTGAASGPRPRPAEVGAERRRYAAPFPHTLATSAELTAVTAFADAANTTPAPLARPALSTSAAVAALATASTREAIGDVLADYLRSALGGGLVFMCKDGMALGWKGFAPGVETAVLQAIALPLAAATFLAEPYEQHQLRRGPPPPTGAALHNRIWKLLHTPPPRETVVAPVVVKDRVINLLYAHAPDGGRISDEHVAGLEAVREAAGSAFVRLIRATKGQR